MGADIRNVELCPMQVFFNGVDLGGTEGGVSVSMKTKISDIKVDQFGDEAVDGVVSGQGYSVKMVLTETKNLDNWKVAFPFAKLVTSGEQKIVYFDRAVGSHLSDFAKALRLHPMSKAAADKTGDYNFYKAVAKSAAELKFGTDKQVGLEVEFLILPDTSVDPARYLLVGDPSVGLVAATLTYSGRSGTGNGTTSGVSAGTNAVTETITATCVTAATDGGVFHVVGSVTGSLGLATVGAPFTSTRGNFTIADGSADFVVGDTITFASVGANYA